jgi:L-ascorbate metabolism protein UlaG (beta-lactamase superfamily)
MRITKFGHACVRIEHDGHVVVIDPGGFTERGAVDGATAVLVTHEHFDHLSIDNLDAAGAPIFTIAAVAAQLPPSLAAQTTVVAPGESFDAGLPVSVVGDRHAVIHPSFPTFANSGYLVSAGTQTVYHPGDAFVVPDRAVDVLCAPVSGPWNKLGEVLDFARAVAAPQTLAIHERLLSDVGLVIVDDRIKAFLEGVGTYHRIADGVDL